jgi:hypothetical protein
MYRLLYSFLLVVALGSVGCVPSKEPLYTEKDLLVDEAILGDWQMQTAEGQATLTIKKSGKNRFKEVRIGSRGERTEFELTLFKLGNSYFTDFAFGSEHYFFKVCVLGDKMVMRTPTMDSLKLYLHFYPKQLKHERTRIEGWNDSFKFTASTLELQAFVMANMNDHSLFQQSMTYQRIGKFPVTPFGLASKKQRTFDYWCEIRGIFRGGFVPFGAKPDEMAKEFNRIASGIADLPTLGVDSVAVDCGVDLIRLLNNTSMHVKKYSDPDKLLEAFMRGITGDITGVGRERREEFDSLMKQGERAQDRFNKARAALTARYEIEFPRIEKSSSK